jgi:hypothetical protein
VTRTFQGSAVCASSKYKDQTTTSTACIGTQQVICTEGAPTPSPTSNPTTKPSSVPTARPTAAPQLYSLAPSVSPTEMPSYPSSYHWPPQGKNRSDSDSRLNTPCSQYVIAVGFLYVKTFTQTAGCTGYYQLEAYSVGVCQLNVGNPGTSFMYSNVQEGSVSSVYFTIDYRTYSDSSCTVESSGTSNTKLYTCNENSVTGLPEVWGHSTYVTEYPTGFVIA